VAGQYDVIKHMLLKPILSGRIGKWAYALVEYDLAYEPLILMKGQVVADFIVDHVVHMNHLIDSSNSSHGGCMLMVRFVVKGREQGVIISPSGMYIDLSIRLEFACTNNQVKYEFL
jgi:hypothetical protein